MFRRGKYKPNIKPAFSRADTKVAGRGSKILQDKHVEEISKNDKPPISHVLASNQSDRNVDLEGIAVSRNDHNEELKESASTSSKEKSKVAKDITSNNSEKDIPEKPIQSPISSSIGSNKETQLNTCISESSNENTQYQKNTCDHQGQQITVPTDERQPIPTVEDSLQESHSEGDRKSAIDSSIESKLRTTIAQNEDDIGQEAADTITSDKRPRSLSLKEKKKPIIISDEKDALEQKENVCTEMSTDVSSGSKHDPNYTEREVEISTALITLSKDGQDVFTPNIEDNTISENDVSIITSRDCIDTDEKEESNSSSVVSRKRKKEETDSTKDKKVKAKKKTNKEDPEKKGKKQKRGKKDGKVTSSKKDGVEDGVAVKDAPSKSKQKRKNSKTSSGPGDKKKKDTEEGKSSSDVNSESKQQSRVRKKELKTAITKGSKRPRLTGPIDESKMTMGDMLFYEKEERKRAPRAKKNADSETVSAPEQQEVILSLEPVNIPENPETKPEFPVNDEDDVIAPQVMVSEDGSIIVKEASLYIKQTDNAQALSETVYEDEDTHFNPYFRRKQSIRNKWSVSKTLKFYRALGQVGTDFTLMLAIFPQETRTRLKRKFKWEEKINGDLVDRALANRLPLNFADLLGQEKTENDEGAE